MVYVGYYDGLDLQVCNHAQKRRICRKNSKYAPYKSFVAIFAFAERLETFATLIQSVDYSWKSDIVQNRFGCCIT